MIEEYLISFLGKEIFYVFFTLASVFITVVLFFSTIKLIIKINPFND